MQKNFSEKICNLHPSARKCAPSHVNSFCVAGNSSKLPVTQKGRVKNEALFFTRPSRPILFCFRIIFLIFSRLPQFRLLPECRHPKISATTGQDCLSGTQLTTWGICQKINLRRSSSLSGFAPRFRLHLQPSNSHPSAHDMYLPYPAGSHSR